MHTTPWIDFLATFGAGLLTFLAGAEIDPESLRRHIRVSLTVGVVSFAAPFVAAFAFAYFIAGWDLQAAEIAGIALSTTSVAVVYAVMIESGLAGTDLGKTILAACFITDLGTVLALGVVIRFQQECQASSLRPAVLPSMKAAPGRRCNVAATGCDTDGLGPS